MQEQLWNQLVQTLQEKANLSPDQANQVAQVVSDFAQQHIGDLLKLGAEQGGGGGMLGNIGGMFNRG
ncbi:MAG: hypothetical protein ACTHNK_01265 [Thermomicrobiales bacterium]|jgi:hypothetical protein|nr:hypothetical protein [Thermomicrobiales bacterium]